MSLNVVTIDTPKLSSVRPDDVESFLEAREVYLAQVDSKNRQMEKKKQIIPDTIKESIDLPTLRFICAFELPEDDITPENVEDEELMEYLEGICPNMIADAGGYNLKLKLKQIIEAEFYKSCDGKSPTLVEAFKSAWGHMYQALVSFGVLDQLEDAKSIKMIAYTFIEALKRRPDLRWRVKATFETISKETNEARKSLKKLYELFLKCAKEQDKEDLLRSRYKSSRFAESEKKRRFGTRRDSDSSNHVTKNRGYRFDERDRKRRKQEQRMRDTSDTTGGGRETRHRGKDRSSYRCYKCHKMGHTVYRCPEVKDMDEALQIARRRKSHNSLALSSVSMGDCDRLIDCWIGRESIPYRALLDSGAFTCFISREMAEVADLDRIDSSSRPKELPLAVRDSVARVVGEVKGTLSLSRPSDGKRIKLRNTRFYLLEGAHDFVIVGDDVLRKLGISPHEQLNKLAVEYSYVPSVSVDIGDTDTRTIDPIAMIEQRMDPLNDNRCDYNTYSAGDAHDALDRLSRSLDAMLERSRPVFNTDKLFSELTQLVYEYKDIWRVDLMDDLIFGNTDPIKVPPYDIRLKPEAVPRRAKMRAYNRLEREFLSKMTSDLTAINCLYRNFESRWSSPSYVVTKPGKPGSDISHFRWTGDIRYVNSMTEKLAGSMPLMSSLLEHLDGAQVFASLDCHKGYWQIPITKRSQEICSFLTPHGIFSPTRLMQGHTDSVAVFQQTMEKVFDGLLYKCMLIWVDDLLGYAKTPKELLQVLRLIFEKCREYNLRISPEKSELGLMMIKWCGRIISGSGIKFDPSMIQGLLELSKPRNAAELQHLLTASNWLRISLPEYAKVVAALTDLLRSSQQDAGSSKKRKLRRFQLTWNDESNSAFMNLKELLRQSVELAHFHHSSEYVLCLFTDASDLFWGIMLTQVSRSEWERNDISSQRHEPLAFLSGAFSGSHMHWPMVIKEAYPIIVALDRLRQYLSLKEFVLYTDHRNLVYLFNHLQRDTDVRKNVSQMIQRWHIKLLGFSYIIEHISGKDNLWADILSRFRPPSPVGAVLPSLSFENVYSQSSSGGSTEIKESGTGGEIHTLNVNEVKSETGSAFAVLTNDAESSEIEEIDIVTAALDGSSNAQYSQIIKRLNQLNLDVHGRYLVESKDLRLSLMILAHCGLSGHRGTKATLNRLTRFYWIGIKQDVETFCKKCIHCLSAQSHGLKTMLSSQLHA